MLGVLPLLRQCDVWLAARWATANGACARKPHHPPRSADGSGGNGTEQLFNPYSSDCSIWHIYVKEICATCD